MTFTLGLLMLINAERAQPLTLDPVLTAKAQGRAEFLCDHPFSHDGWRAWVQDVPGYSGENLAKGFKTRKATHAALMASPTHAANITSAKYSRIGIAKRCGITVEIFAQ